jgi:hypothetical protein
MQQMTPLQQEHKLNVTTRQFLRDFAFTCAAALATGGIVSAVAVILFFVRD